MASTVTPPVAPVPPVPPQYPRRRRSFAGPIVLIIIGFIFLLVTSGQLSMLHLATLYAKYWPLLLILWGAVKLIEHQMESRDGVPHRGIGAGGVMLIVVIVFWGLIATQAERVNWHGLGDHINIDDEDFSNIFGNTYSYDQRADQEIPAGLTSVRINNDHGTVRVTPSDDNKIVVMAHKRIGADNQGTADSYNDKTKPTITVNAGSVMIDAKTQGAGDHPVQSDLDISVPRKAEVHIVSRHGDVSVDGRDAGVEISNQRGSVDVEGIKGYVKLSLEKSAVRLAQITGDVRVEGRLNEISVDDVQGAVQLDGEFMESVKLARITKTVNFKSSRTDMEFSKIDGSLDLDSDDLRANQITGPLRLTTRAKEIRLDNVSGDARVQNEDGGVELDMRTAGNVQIDNRKGDIKVSLPEHAGFRVDARTRDGEIQSDFSELNVSNNDDNGKVNGSVGNGSAHLVLNNEHGGIEIRRGTPTPPTPPSLGKPGKVLPPSKDKVVPEEN